MFGNDDRFYRLEQKIKSLENRIYSLHAEIALLPSKAYVEKWNDALDKDLRAEIALLADALGYKREVGGPKYRKAHTK